MLPLDVGVFQFLSMPASHPWESSRVPASAKVGRAWAVHLTAPLTATLPLPAPGSEPCDHLDSPGKGGMLTFQS